MNDYVDPELERLKAAAADALRRVGATRPCPRHPHVTVVADRERAADAYEVAAGIMRETGFGWMRSDLRFAVGDRMAAAVERCAECDGVGTTDDHPCDTS